MGLCPVSEGVFTGDTDWLLGQPVSSMRQKKHWAVSPGSSHAGYQAHIRSCMSCLRNTSKLGMASLIKTLLLVFVFFFSYFGYSYWQRKHCFKGTLWRCISRVFSSWRLPWHAVVLKIKAYVSSDILHVRIWVHIYPQILVLCFVCFCSFVLLFSQGLAMWPWLAWNLEIHLPLPPGTGTEGMRHYVCCPQVFEKSE